MNDFKKKTNSTEVVGESYIHLTTGITISLFLIRVSVVQIDARRNDVI